MFSEKDLIFLGAAIIWAANRNCENMNTPNQAVHESKKLFDKTFKAEEE